MPSTYQVPLQEIAQVVFSTMSNMELAPLVAPVPEQHEFRLATIHISGAWTGTVVLGLNDAMARAAAAEMLQVPESEVSEADASDVASELANMIGGNLKSILPAPSYLSLPTVVSGREFDWQVLHAQMLDDVQLSCGERLVHVQLFEKNGASD